MEDGIITTVPQHQPTTCDGNGSWTYDWYLVKIHSSLIWISMVRPGYIFHVSAAKVCAKMWSEWVIMLLYVGGGNIPFVAS